MQIVKITQIVKIIQIVKINPAGVVQRACEFGMKREYCSQTRITTRGGEEKAPQRPAELRANQPMLQRTARRPGNSAKCLPFNDVMCYRNSAKAPKACPGKNPDGAGFWGVSSTALGSPHPTSPLAAGLWGRVQGGVLSLFWWTTARGDRSSCVSLARRGQSRHSVLSLGADVYRSLNIRTPERNQTREFKIQ